MSPTAISSVQATGKGRMGWGVEVGAGSGVGRELRRLRAGDRASSSLAPPAADTWPFFWVCIALFPDLSQAGSAPADSKDLLYGGEKAEKLPEILPPPLPSILKESQKPGWEAEGLGCCYPSPGTLGKPLCLLRPQFLYLNSTINSPQETWMVGGYLRNAGSPGLVSSCPGSPDYPTFPIQAHPFPSPTATATCWEMKTSPAKRSWEGHCGPGQRPRAVSLAAFSCRCWR